MQRSVLTWLVVVVLAGLAVGAERPVSSVPQGGAFSLTDATSETWRPAAGPVPLAPASPESLQSILSYPAAVSGQSANGFANSPGTGQDGLAGRPWGNAWYRFKTHMQWSHWGYPEEFLGTPLAANLRHCQQLQIGNGVAARFVLYRYDFGDESGTDAHRLNAHGAKRLTEMVVELQVWPQRSVVVERSPGKQPLDSARVEHVAQQFRQANVSVPVVAGDPPVQGLRGDEAKTLSEGLRRHNQQGGSTSVSSR